MAYEDDNGDYHDDDCDCDNCYNSSLYFRCKTCGDKHRRRAGHMYVCNDCSDEYCRFCASKHGIRAASDRPARFNVPRCMLTVTLLANDGGED